jgi:uncharacterized membrane protein
MKESRKMWIGTGLGAGAMYLMDPSRGRRRRAMVRDKMVRATHKATEAFGTTARDVRHRLAGAAAFARDVVQRGQADDEVLAERVRSRIGRVVRHPGALGVRVNQGRAILSGPVLADEVYGLLKKVSSVKGVRGVENRLEVHETPENIPALQGDTPLPEEKPEPLQENWTPALRFGAGAAGVGLLAYGRRQGGFSGLMIRASGAGLIVRALANKPFKKIVGADRWAVDIRKSVNINAPVEKVFDVWSHYENFPRFMSHVREVREMEKDRSHWVVEGPAGVPVEWDAVLTRWEPNQELGWKTVPGSLIQHAGLVQLKPNPDGRTNVTVRLRYNPGAGAVGHAAAKLFRADPKAELDDDLLRMKTFIETGQRPHDAAQP